MRGEAAWEVICCLEGSLKGLVELWQLASCEWKIEDLQTVRLREIWNGFVKISLEYFQLQKGFSILFTCDFFLYTVNLFFSQQRLSDHDFNKWSAEQYFY